VSDAYRVSVQNRFEALGTLSADVEEAWTAISTALRTSAETVIGRKNQAKRPWLSHDTYQVLLAKADARKRQDKVERKRLQGIFRAKAKADREAFFANLASEAEAGLITNRLRPAYRAIKALRPGPLGGSAPAPVTKADGSPCSSQDELLQRWKEFYDGALNYPNAPLAPT
jgi:hypothetical protein